jgi:hypothetical protein
MVSVLALGTTSFNSSSRFPSNSAEYWYTPVTLPPGRATSHKPATERIAGPRHDDGNSYVRFLGRLGCSCARYGKDFNLETD